MSERKQALLDTAKSLPFEDVETPEFAAQGWPVVRVKTMGSDDYDEWEAIVLGVIAKSKVSGESPLKGQRAALVVCTACDPQTGERIFTAQDAGAVGKLDGNALNRLAAAAQHLNPTSSEDQKDLEKNSARGRTGAFSSVLRWLPAASMWTDLLKRLRPGKFSNGAPSSASKASPSGPGATG